MSEDNRIFRKKSLERVASPEQLNDYIRAASPGMWMVLLAAVVFLAGMAVWGTAGRLETTVRGAVAVKDGTAVLYVAEESAGSIRPGQTVKAGGAEFAVGETGGEPVLPSGENDSDAMGAYLLHAGGFAEGEWLFGIPLDGPSAADGIYACEVVTGSVSPLSFLLN